MEKFKNFMKGVAWLMVALVIFAWGVLPVFGVNSWTPKWPAFTGSLFATQPIDAFCGKPAPDQNNRMRWALSGQWWKMDRERPTPVERLCIRHGRAFWESEL